MSYGGEGVARMRVLQVVVLIVFGVIAARLAYIQLIDSKYEELARGNALRYEVQYPSRGEVFDRNGEYLVQSRECYDLMVIYREMDREGFDTTLFCCLLYTSECRFPPPRAAADPPGSEPSNVRPHRPE